MKVVLESTERVVTLNGVEARIWQGRSEGGVLVHAYVTRIAAFAGGEKDLEEFNRELAKHAAPRPDVEAIPARLLL